MDAGTTVAIIGFLVVVCVLIYFYYDKSEEKAKLTGLNVGDLLTRIKESERFFTVLKNTPCFFCSSSNKKVTGNLFEEGLVQVTCVDCGAEVSITRKKTWNIIAETKTPAARTFATLREEIEKETKRLA
jgi:hypothetical protein